MFPAELYERLPQEAEDGPDHSKTAHSSGLHAGRGSILRRFETWAVFASLLCTTLNLALFFSTPQSSSAPALQATRLPRPNQYIGLERVNRKFLNATPPDPIVTFPLVLTQVTSRRPQYVFPVDTHRQFTPGVGTVSSDDKPFVVNSTTNSIAQFRVRDWGMELCQIVISISSQSAENATENTSVSLSEPTAAVDMWELEADDYDFIDVRTLSWNNRPSRRTTLPMTTLSLQKGANFTTEKFSCRRDSIQTFELSCRLGSDHCLVDFWQDGVSTSLGMYMIQYPTI